MCLTINAKVKKAPKQVRAWKMVQINRKPIIYTSGAAYKVGKTIRARKPKGAKWRKKANGYFPNGRVTHGIHVYMNKPHLNPWSVGDHIVIAVQVRPSDWIASGQNGQAAYKKVRVLT